MSLPAPTPFVTRRRIRTEVLAATDDGHHTELLYDDGANDEVLVCAAHGGDVEPGTTEQALELATRLPNASCWTCMGYAEGEGEAFDRFHPPSSAIQPADYPLLAAVADRGFGTVVSLHGLAEEAVLVGGAVDRGVKRRVQQRLDEVVDVPVEVVSDGEYGGVSPENFANWLAADGGGLQLEQGPTVRDRESAAVLAVLEELCTAETL